MTDLNDLMDERIRKRQDNCPHLYQDRIEHPLGVFCGKCAKREEVI